MNLPLTIEHLKTTRKCCGCIHLEKIDRRLGHCQLLKFNVRWQKNNNCQWYKKEKKDNKR